MGWYLGVVGMGGMATALKYPPAHQHCVFQVMELEKLENGDEFVGGKTIDVQPLQPCHQIIHKATR